MNSYKSKSFATFGQWIGLKQTIALISVLLGLGCEGAIALNQKIASNQIALNLSPQTQLPKTTLAQTPEDGYAEAQRRIQEARETKATALGLSELGLRSLPPEIEQLSNLQALYLEKNQLRSLPPEIVKLSNLKELNLSLNQLTSLPPEIDKLSRLGLLIIRGNPLPPEVMDKYSEKYQEVPE